MYAEDQQDKEVIQNGQNCKSDSKGRISGMQRH